MVFYLSCQYGGYLERRIFLIELCTSTPHNGEKPLNGGVHTFELPHFLLLLVNITQYHGHIDPTSAFTLLIFIQCQHVGWSYLPYKGASGGILIMFY